MASCKSVRFSLVLVAVLCGCSATALEPQPLPISLLKLGAGNRYPARLRVSAPAELGTVGYVHFLFFVPVESLELVDPGAHLMTAAFRKLALSRIKPLMQNDIPGADASAGPACQAPVAEFTLRDAEMGVYDLLVTRRIFARAAITASLCNSRGKLAASPDNCWNEHVECSAGELMRVPRVSDLRRVLENSFDCALDKLFDGGFETRIKQWPGCGRWH